jgi:formiminotetrahydrofolate cyclodeaminase
MSENISNNALILALLSLNGEITLQKDYLESDDIPEDEIADEEEVLDDLEQAFMEFVDAYKARAKADKTLPELEELLAGDA